MHERMDTLRGDLAFAGVLLVMVFVMMFGFFAILELH